ncbi:MAG: prolipoprotein diacylglyceryl transferase [Eubacterium sp.]|nr:prolipoprotein diacylglyceryl transferase [Eubacterium sp.]
MAAKGISFPNLHIHFANLPKTINIFGLDIALYGIIIAVGMIAGLALGLYIAKKTNQDSDLYIDLAIFGIIFGVLGARIYYVLFSLDYYTNHPTEIIDIRQGGLAIYGGVIAAVITALVISKIKKAKFTLVADTAIYGLILGQIIGRWGNFVNREAYGQVTTLKNPLAMRLYFDNNFSILQVPPAIKQDMESLFHKPLSQIGFVQVQPTFLYESLWNLIVLILMLVFRKKKAFDGEILLWYLFGYGLGRFIIEGFRSDQLLIPGIGFPVSQLLSALLVITAVVIDVFVRVKKKNGNEAQSENNN